MCNLLCVRALKNPEEGMVPAVGQQMERDFLEAAAGWGAMRWRPWHPAQGALPLRLVRASALGQAPTGSSAA